jgi:serine/threonine-protein kinase
VIFFRPGGGLFWQAADSSGHEEALSTTAGPGMLPSGVTPDGRRVLFTRGSLDVMAMALDDRRVEPLVQTPFNDRNGVVSPDGNWLAYESNEMGKFEIYVVPYPNVKGARSPVSAAGGTRPLWSRNGNDLFFVAPDGAIMAVSVDARGSVWRSGAPVKVVDAKYSTSGPASGRNYDVSADGRFLMVKAPPNDQADAPQIRVVQHWTEELQRLVPAPK